MKEGDILFTTPKMGIVPEVNSYDVNNFSMLIRESIINSIASGISVLRITIVPKNINTNLILQYEGIGMDENEFKTMFLALGGSQKYYDENHINRMGLNILIWSLVCDNLIIFTRKNDRYAIEAEIYLKDLMKQSIRLESIQNFPIGKILKVYTSQELQGKPDQYTKIELKNIHPNLINLLNNPINYGLLIEKLRKTLPLTFPEGCALFNNISEELKNRLIFLASNPSIEIYLNGEKLIKKVFGDELDEKFNILMEIINEKIGSTSFTGYILEHRRKMKNWNGLISRYQNMTVEDRGFLEWDKKPSLLIRMSGELFLEGLDKDSSININWNHFNANDEQFLKLREKIWEKLDIFTKTIYKRAYIASGLRNQNLKNSSHPIKNKHSMHKKMIKKKDVIKAFVSYNHKDERFLKEFKTNISPILRVSQLDLWDDTRIKPGEDWNLQIEEALNNSDIAILLVSENFIASDFIYKEELQPILKKAKEKGLTIFWIYISPCLFETVGIDQFQAAHNISKPLSSLKKPDRQKTWVEICKKIKMFL